MIGPAVLAGAAALASADPAAVPCRTEVVPLASGPRLESFMAWLAGQDGDGDYLFDEERRGFSGRVRIADIDNDGTEDFVISSVEGSGRYLNLYVFRPVGEGYAPVALPEGLEFDHAYTDPATGEMVLLERLCGRTYLSVGGGEATRLAKVTYRLKGGGFERACDSEWLREQRREFQARFDRGQYRAARPLLEGTGLCAKEAEPELWLRLQADAALAAHRMRTHGECLALVEEAQRSAAHARGSPEVRRALSANAERCREARRRLRTPAGQDFTWLLELEKKPARQLVLDPRFEDVLTAVVPDVGDEEGLPLREQMRLTLYVPGETRITEGRFVEITGCMPHACGEKGFVWLDLASKRSVAYSSGRLVSMSFGPDEIPRAVWARLRETMHLMEGEEIVFVDAGGARRRIAVPEAPEPEP